MRVLGLSLLPGCCLPVSEVHRPPIHGRVTHAGAPVAGALVSACTFSSWGDPACDPARVVSAVTAGDGSFDLPPESSFPTIVFGEAPLMETVVWVCRPEGAASAVLGFLLTGPQTVSLELGAPPALLGQVRTGGAAAFAAARCP